MPSRKFQAWKLPTWITVSPLIRNLGLDRRISCLFLFCLLCSPAQSLLSPAPTFSVEPDNYFSRGLLYYRKLTLDEDASSLYVGAMNHVFRLWMFNVNDTENSAFFRERELKPSQNEVAKCAYSTQDPNFHCQNHVRELFRLTDNSLYVCSSNAYSPIVFRLDTETLATLSSPINGIAVCGFDPNDNGTAVYVESGNPENIPSVYSGSVTDTTQTTRIIYRPPLMDQSGRFIHQFMRTVHTDSKWLNDAQFVGSFESSEYVYFFFREIAVEFANCGKAVYSRVARICKKDIGGQNVLKQNWATFIKARLNCSLDGDFPFYFDQIQDIYKVDLESGDSVVYGTFSTSLNGFYGSAVCAFSLREINSLLDSGTFKEQVSSSAAWLPVLPSRVPDPRPGKCQESTKSISDSDLHFIKSHSLLDGSVGSLGGRPLFFRKNLVLTKLAADILQSQDQTYHVVFAASDTGEVFKMGHWEDGGSHESSLLATFSLPSKTPIRDMVLYKNEYVYVSQDWGVSQVSVSQCRKYESCQGCTLDPYCSWNNLRHHCARAHQSHYFTTGWVVSDPKRSGENRKCGSPAPKRDTKVLYPGDAAYLECPSRGGEESGSGSGGVRAEWSRNNRTLLSIPTRYLLTVDGGLVIVNSSLDDSGQYICHRGRQIVASYQVFVDKVNCQKPHNIKAFQSVYREWCREFQEYKHTMLKWKQWYEQNTQCMKGAPDFKKLPSPISFDAELKTNKLHADFHR